MQAQLTNIWAKTVNVQVCVINYLRVQVIVPNLDEKCLNFNVLI